MERDGKKKPVAQEPNHRRRAHSQTEIGISDVSNGSRLSPISQTNPFDVLIKDIEQKIRHFEMEAAHHLQLAEIARANAEQCRIIVRELLRLAGKVGL
jgi:hypothetical protein